MEHTQSRPSASTAPAEAKTESTTLVRVFAAAMGALILVQGFLGGRGFFISPKLLDAHEMVGSLTWLVAAGQVAVVFFTIKSRERAMLLGMSIAVLVLTTIQMGLGFSAKDGSGESAAWHLFNAVLLTGAIAAYANTVFFRLKRG